MSATQEMELNLEEIIQEWKDREGNVIMVLHQIQNKLGYVPRSVALEVSRSLNIPLARIYEVITFYHLFKTRPPGKHNVSVCMGTACYLRGGERLMDEFKKELKIKEDETTPDGEFDLRLVRCIGCCGIAPAVVVDHEVHGSMKPEGVRGMIEAVSGKEAEHAN